MTHSFTSRKMAPRDPGGFFCRGKSAAYRWVLAMFLFIAGFSSHRANAITLTIGTGTTTTSYYPIYTFYGYNYSQSTYLASDLVAAGATSGTPGFISSISYYATTYYSGFTTLCKDWVVYMGNTSKSTFSGTTDWVPLASLTKVFDGVAPCTGTGWFTINFPTPFYWDGSSNLVVAVDENTPSYTSTMSWQATSRTGTRSISYYNDGTNPDPASPPTANTTGAITANIQLNYTPATPCGSSVTGGTAVASSTTLCPGGSVILNTTGATAGTGLTYVWDTSSTGTGGWAAVSGSLTFPAFTYAPPSGRTLYYRCRITCTATSATATSTTVAVAVSSSMTLPYTETFESATAGVNVPCAAVSGGAWGGTTSFAPIYDWTLLSGTSSYYSSITNHTPGGSKYITPGYYEGKYYSSSNPAAFWYTPGFNLQAGKTYRFSYWYATPGPIVSSGLYTFGMYFGTSQTAAAMTAIKADLIGKSNTAYEQNVGDFTVPADGVYYLGVMIDRGYYYYGIAIDDINLIELPACNTATSSTFGRGGKAAASPNVICSTPGTTTLSVSGTPAFSGLSFSWEVATGTPTTFTATPGTTATYAYTIPTGGTYYFRCKVSCTATGLTTYSDTVKVITTPIVPPYVEDFEGGSVGTNLPCASFTGSFVSGSIYWDLRSGPYSGYPGVTNHTTGGAKYLFAGYYMGSYSGTGPQFWFTPGLALTAGKAYNFSLWFSNTAYTGYSGSSSELGIRAGSSQTAAGMTLVAGTDTVVRPNDVSTPTYNKFQRGFIAPTTGTYYVGIRWNPASGNPCYPGIAIDDLGLDQLPPCSAKPSAGTATASPSVICSSSGTSLLTLAGVSVASDLSFQWQSSPTGLPGTWTNISGATLPGYTTTTPAAAMWYRCIVVCPLVSAPNADTSAPVQVKVTPITPPYYEDFESGNAGVNMPCASNTSSWAATTYWFLRDGAFSTSYPAIVNHTTGGKKYIHAGYALGSYSTGATEYWFTPALALTKNKAYEVSYWFNGSGYSGGATLTGVAAGTSQTSAAMTILAGTDTIVNTSKYLQIKRAFISPTTGTYFVGIKVNNLVYSYPGVAFDDIGIEQMPPCSGKPVAGTAMCSPSMICSSGTTTLSLKGTSMASDLTFQWYDVTAGLPGTLITGATSPTYTTPTLTATKRYRCVVTCPLSSAPNTDTSSIIVVNVGAITPPYKEDFEGATIGVNVPCAAITSTWAATSRWYLYGAAFSPSYPAIKNNTPGGSKYLYAGYTLGSYSAGANQFWFTPAIRFTAGETYQFSYWYSGSGYSGGSTNLGMYYGTSQTAAAMTTAIIPDKVGVNTGTYKQLLGRFIAPATGNYYVGVKVNHTVYSYPGIAIDDIGLEQLPPCTGKATAGAVSASPAMICSTGTVGLDMDLGGVSKVAGLTYTWEVSTTSATSGFASLSAPLTSPSYTTGTISTTSWFRCIVTCTATGDTTISSVVKVDVGAITPPYVETFETVKPGTNAPCASYTYAWASYCWYTFGAPLSTSYPAYDNHTPGGSNYLGSGYYPGYYSGADEYWFSPAIKFTGGKLYQVSLWYNGSGYGGGKTNLGLYYGTAQTKAAMTTAIGTDLVGINTTTYKYLARKFTPTTSGNYYLGIKVNNTAYAYPGLAIDDIGIQEVPPCGSTVVAGSITADPTHVCAIGGTTTLDLTGSTLATGLSYTWLSAPTAVGPFTPTGGTGLPYTTSLSAPTWFKCVVTCGATGSTDTTAAFRVGVGGFDLPYKEDFESTGTGQVPLCSDATCWAPYYYNGWIVYTGTLSGAFTNNTPGGKNWLMAGYYMGYITDNCGNPASDNNYWWTPGFNFKAGYKYKLSFYYVASATSTGNKIGVYYGTTQSVGAMTNVIKPLTLVTNTSYEKFDTTFKVSTSGLNYIGLRKSAPSVGTYSYYGVAFDDINLNYAPCDDLPMAGAIVGTVASGTALCKNSFVALLDTGATLSAVPGIKYQWYRRTIGGTGSGTVVAGATDTLLASDTLIGYEYRLAVTCTNVSKTAYSAWYALPELPPHPPVTIAPSGTINFCLGDTVHLNATNYTGAVYDWMLDGKTVSGWKFSDMGATEPGTYVVKVTSAASPCPGYSNAVKLVATDPGFKVDVTTPADSILCAGDAVILTASPSKSGVTFQWRKNNVVIPGATGSTYTVTSAGFYRVAAYDGISACPAISRNIEFVVKPNPPATISIPGGTLTACENEGVKLDANTGGYTYQWYRGGSPIFGWVDSSVVAKTSGVYTVKVRTKDGCATTSTGVTVNILPSPTPIISLSGTTLSTTGTYVTYKWYRNGTFTGITTPTLSLTLNGLYTVVVTDANGCEGESMPFEVMMPGLGINNVTVTAADIQLYPNPTESKVFIESPVDVKIEVKDVTGRVLMEKWGVKEIDMAKYADGMYMFIISNKDGVLVKKEKVNKVSK